MAEIAQPVTEAPIAPATPQANSVPSASSERKTLGYKVADVPAPLTSQDRYMHAQLVEARASRAAIERLADAVEALAANMAQAKESAKK